jgi:hypothetical protein
VSPTGFLFLTKAGAPPPRVRLFGVWGLAAGADADTWG